MNYVQLLSPLSRSPQKTSPAVSNQPRSSIAKQYLDVENARFQNNANNIQIKAIDYRNKLLINTPTKQHLMNFGLSSIVNVDVLGKGMFACNMGTPVRRLLFPKLLSPLSRSPQKTSPALSNQPRSSIAKQYLNVENARFQNNANNIQIKGIDYRNKLLINTPTKQHLMNFGLSSIVNVDVLGKGMVAAKIVKLRKNDLKEKNALNLKHENLVKIIDVIYNVGCSYAIVMMEYLKSSKHLQSVIDDSNIDLTLEQISKYALDISKGLKYCHDNNLLHLDVKPTNVLLCENCTCKLCDFGNSLRLDECTAESAKGTVVYSAPELLLAKSPTVKSDVYSLGIVMWQMRYRRIPYSHLNDAEVVIYNVVKHQIRPNSGIEERDEYHMIFSSCWSAEPNERPELSQVISKLNAII
ncbi:hypothetical protein FQR65_LT05521 [Abscondita terminalis]|nr:hypothetical protein FQR65_LT05521 [Abscondita terminalis]